MNARRYAPGIAMAMAGFLLVWGSISTLSAQDTGDSTRTTKSSRHTSKTSRHEMSSSNKTSGKIIDKLGGMSTIDALTDRFLADIMGTTSAVLNPGTTQPPLNQTMTGGTLPTGGSMSGNISMQQGGVSGIGQTGVSGSGMGADTMGNTGMAPHATVDTMGRMGATGTVGTTESTGTMGNTGVSGSAGVTGTTGNVGVTGTTSGQYGTSGTMGNTGVSGSGMGTSMGMGARSMGGWDYTAVREDVRTRLCKAAGGDCKVRKLSKKEAQSQPSLTENEWNAAVNDLKTALASYNLSAQDQDKLVSAVNGAKKDFVRGTMDQEKMMKEHGGKMHQRMHSGASGTTKGGSMGTDTTGRGSKGY